MDKRLHNLYSEIDNEFDINRQDYFNLPEEQKQLLTRIIIEYYLPMIRKYDDAVDNLLFAYNVKMQEAQEEEHYEEADMCKRIIMTLEEINSLNEEDWKPE